MINWMLEVEGVEGVTCTENDMETTRRERTLGQRGWGWGCEGRGGEGEQEYSNSKCNVLQKIRHLLYLVRL